MDLNKLISALLTHTGGFSYCEPEQALTIKALQAASERIAELEKRLEAIEKTLLYEPKKYGDEERNC